MNISKTLTDKCIVLDLDETLVHVHEPDDDPTKSNSEDIDVLLNLGILKDNTLEDLRDRTFIINFQQGYKDYIMWGTLRPHLKEFLIFCFSYFRIVVIWSAGQAAYVKSICDKIFIDLQPPHILYANEKCIKDKTGLTAKPLELLISQEPELEKYMGLNNTFIVDDKKHNYENVNSDNGIHIPEYAPLSTVETLREPDDYLLRLMSWFTKKEVVECKDVRILDKSKIFDTSESKLNFNIRELLDKSNKSDKQPLKQRRTLPTYKSIYGS